MCLLRSDSQMAEKIWKCKLRGFSPELLTLSSSDSLLTPALGEADPSDAGGAAARTAPDQDRAYRPWRAARSDRITTPFFTPAAFTPA